MKELPVGRQNFADIIQQDLLYVDKTAQIFNLLERGSLYFLSRPRRFGKSLLISLFKHLFSGEKELFKHLYIGQKTNYNFEKYPVLQFNLANVGGHENLLLKDIKVYLKQYATQFEVHISEEDSINTQLKRLVEQIAAKGKPVVILVDEYDKNIVHQLSDIKQVRENLSILRSFFSPLKGLESAGHIRFLFITGVSKFSKVSLFSDLNNLKDLIMHPFSNQLLGITQEELLDNFAEYISAAAASFNVTENELLPEIKRWYNGYSFDGKTTLYNPYSLLHFFQQQRFANFWFETGTPTFLVETIRDRGITPQSLEEQIVPSTFFTKFSIEDLEMTGLLYQTGYLTIKKIERRGFIDTYFLGYPNVEVKHSFIYNLLEAFTFKGSSVVGNALVRMQRGLEDGQLDIFIEQLKILLSDIAYHLLPPKKNKTATQLFSMWEGYFHTIIYLITSFMSFEVQAEVTKHQGRLDLVLETEQHIYLMEFKLEESAKSALQQIKKRKYANTYQNSEKIVHLVRINFSKEERNVKDWKQEILS